MSPELVVLRKLSRKLNFLIFWFTLFGVILLTGFVIIGIVLFKLLTFTHSAETKITSLDKITNPSSQLKQQLCSDSSLSSVIKADPSICN